MKIQLDTANLDAVVRAEMVKLKAENSRLRSKISTLERQAERVSATKAQLRDAETRVRELADWFRDSGIGAFYAD